MDVKTRILILMLNILISLLAIGQIKNCEFNFGEHDNECMTFKIVYEFGIEIKINLGVSTEP